MTTRPWMIALLACAALAAGACGGEDGDDGTPGDPDAAPIVADAAPDGAPACGAAELCARTRGECMIDITEAACLGFYDPATTTCADIDGYTACNCGCIEEPTCSEYFDCGTLCFEDWC